MYFIRIFLRGDERDVLPPGTTPDQLERAVESGVATTLTEYFSCVYVDRVDISELETEGPSDRVFP